MNTNGFSVRTAPPGSLTMDETLQPRISHVPSDIMLPFINVMNENTRRIISEQKIDNEKRQEIVTNLIKASEERAVQRATASDLPGKAMGDVNELTAQSKKAVARIGKMNGIDVICEDAKLSRALSLWACARIAADLSIYWSNSEIAVRNSTFAVMLFGVQKSDGHEPYGTTIGKDLGIQSREVVSRLMWAARCTVPEKSNDNGMIPRWLFSLVPVCRQEFIGSQNTSQNSVNESPNIQADNTIPSGTLSDHAPRSGSTRTSEAAVIDDYRDLADSHEAWKKETAFFKIAVARGCRSVEQRKSCEKPRKSRKITQLGIVTELDADLNARNAQNSIAQGAEAVRKACSKFLSLNRYNCRQQFFEAIGFILYKFKVHGKEHANQEGFFLRVPTLSSREKEAFTSRENFNNAVPTTLISTENEGSRIDDINLRFVQDLIQQFPNLTAKLEYPVRIDDDADRRRHNESERNIPESYLRKDNTSLVSLSLVILTEYTRSVNSRAFLASSKKSLHAVIVVAMSIRGLILRSLGDRVDAFQSYALGNVYFAEDDVPSLLKHISTFISFRSEDSNVKRLKKKLSISKKRYLSEECLNRESEEGIEREEIENWYNDEDDIFSIPS